jgi:hypothetical protein
MPNARRVTALRVRRASPSCARTVRLTAPRLRRGRLRLLQRWHDARTTLADLQARYAAWLESLPESLQGSATAEALQAIVDLDLSELLAIEPPRGFGRD